MTTSGNLPTTQGSPQPATAHGERGPASVRGTGLLPDVRRARHSVPRPRRRVRERLRIAQVAPLFESVPPRLYGGTERVVSYLTEELVRLGHDVTLFASGDSTTRARLVAGCPEALRLGGVIVHEAAHVLMLEQLLQRADGFDAIHFHVDLLHLPLARRLNVPHLTTVHGRLDLPELVPLYREFDDVPLVSISDAQRTPLPFARWHGTVHHGLPRDLLRPGAGDGGYLAFLGRVSPEKGIVQAIEIAGQAGLELRVAAKVDRADHRYFAEQVAPLIAQDHVRFVGEIGEADKSAFLGGARALLCPIDWPEPFGLVIIEALACGTPVIAFRRGSVPELIDDGTSGFVVDDVAGAVAAVRRLPELTRARCRAAFERRFTAERMAREYVALYERLLVQSESEARGTLGA